MVVCVHEPLGDLVERFHTVRVCFVRLQPRRFGNTERVVGVEGVLPGTEQGYEPLLVPSTQCHPLEVHGVGLFWFVDQSIRLCKVEGGAGIGRVAFVLVLQQACRCQLSYLVTWTRKRNSRRFRATEGLAVAFPKVARSLAHVSGAQENMSGWRQTSCPTHTVLNA